MEPSQRPDIPLAPAACGLGLGLAAALLPLTAPMTPLLPAPLLLLMVLRRTLRPVLLGLLIGLLLGRAHAGDTRAPAPLAALTLPGFIELEGTIQRADLPARGAQRFTLGEVRLESRPVSGQLKVTLRLRGRASSGWRTLCAGMRLRCLVRLRARYGRVEGFIPDRRAVLHLTEAPAGRQRMAAGRAEAAGRLAAQLSRRDTGLARALLLGDRGLLERRDRSLFRNAGQAHLLAVSGLHVGLLVAGLMLLLRILGLGPRAMWIAGLVAVAFYVPFAGAPTSAVRAGLGASAYFLARLAGRQPRGTGVLVLVGICVLLSEPTSLGEPSFQLSFAAVAGILLLSPRIREVLVRPRPMLPGLLPRQRAPLRSALAVSMAAWLGTAPFVALHIGRICPAGPLLSLPAMPVLAVLLASGFALLFLAPVPGLAHLAAVIFALGAASLRWFFELTRSLHLNAVAVGEPTTLWGAAYAAAFVVSVRGSSSSTRIGVAAMATLLLLLLLPPTANLSCVAAVRTQHPHSAPRAVREYHAPLTPMTDLLAATTPANLSTLAFAGAALAAFAVLSVRPFSWLRPGGAVGAWVLGMAAVWQFGWAGLLALLAPFLVATVLGKLPGPERAAARSTKQVLSNGLPALFGCLLAAAGRPELGGPFFLGGLACLGADSCATEIGVRFGGRPWRLVGSGPLEAGESGGVTAAGLVASLLGGALAPLAFALWLRMPLEGAALFTAAGFAGGLIDSVLGGSLQYRGRDPETGAVVERRFVAGVATEPVSGLRWLDNDAVNLVSGLAAGLLATSLTGLFG